MKKEQSFGEIMRQYKDSEDAISLYAERIRQERNFESIISKEGIQTIKQFLEKKEFRENKLRETRMKRTLMSVAPIHVLAPKMDLICFNNLEIKLEDTQKLKKSNDTKVGIIIVDEDDLVVVELEETIEEVISIPLRKLKTGRYYWTIEINGNTKTGRFLHCSNLDAMILNDL